MPPSHRELAAGLTPAGGAPVLPRFDGYATVNLLATLLSHLGATAPAPALADGLLPPGLLDGVDRIVLAVVDALGYGQLLDYADLGAMPHTAALMHQAESGDGAFFPLTTVFPSTTAVALTAIFTGVPPARHGLLNYNIYLPELDDVVDLIFAYRHSDGSAVDRPDPLLHAPAIGERLSAAGVPAAAVTAAQFRGSLLSAVHFRGATFAGYQVPAALPAAAAAAWAALPRRGFLSAYWPGLDLAAHLYGPLSPQCQDEAHIVDGILGRMLARLQDTGPRDRTLLVLLADHGQVDREPDRSLELHREPSLLSLLRRPPAGERRALYLYPRPGAADDVRGWAEARGAWVLAGAEAWASGWFGGPPAAPGFAERVGDLVVLPPGAAQWIYWPGHARRARLLPGGHGGLLPAEMLVPCLMVRV